MAASFIATTPTRSRSPASINTPRTPRLGAFGDNWEPYSPVPRKSARISSRAADNRTPSPNSSVRISRPPQPRALANTSASRASAPRASAPCSHPTSSDNMTSPPATLSPQKKRQPAAAASASASRSVSGSLTAESIRNAAAALGQSQKMDSLTASTVAAALPTPAKTPARKHTEQSVSEVTAVARNLFGKQQAVQQEAQVETEQPFSSPKKTRTRRTNHGISLDSFEIHDEQASIEIFTDSENRLPELDASTENPFYGETGIAASAVPVRRSSRHKKSTVEKELVEEKLKRVDGILYVFRGKKLFRKFTEGDAASRAAVKPRLLFPTAAKASKENEIVDDDEEAETDIEEQAPKPAPVEELTTPTETLEKKVDTPKAPKFAPTSPPSTSRATRSTKKLIGDQITPVKGKGKRAGGSQSPFNGWRRTKSTQSSQSSSTGQKRAGDPLVSEVPKKNKT